MSRYAKKPQSKYLPPQDANRRVQTEAADVDDIDLQQAILKFKNLQDKCKTPQKFTKPKSKSPTPSSLFGNNTIIKQDYTTFTYTTLKIIGQGSFGVVYKAKANETGEIVAIKKVLQDKRYKNRELQILQELGHTNCICLKHAYYSNDDQSDDTYLNVIMDYLPETLSSLNTSYVKQQQTMPEVQAKLYAYQLLRSVSYIQSIGICHRDIKPHNVLVNPITNELKLCDFGSAKKLTVGEPNIAYICSRCYRAPELMFGATEYTTQIDVWSTGCVIAEMLNGEPLFLGSSAVEQLVEIIKVLGTPTKEDVMSMNEQYDMRMFKVVQIRKRDWRKVFSTVVDPLAVDLISKLLVYCPNTRITALQALAHPYFDDLRDEQYLKQLAFKKIGVPELFDFTREEVSRDPSLVSKLVPKWLLRKK